MAPVKLRYLVEDTDKRGNVRWYVRVPGRKKVRIRARLNEDGTLSDAFMSAYFRAIRGVEEEQGRPKLQRVAEGSFQYALTRYYASPLFKGHEAATQRDKRSVLDRYAVNAGPLPLAAFRREDIEKSRDKRRERPGAADKLVKYLKAFFAWCERERLIAANPATGVTKINTSSEGFHAWTPDEVRQFEKAHPIGSQARLALALLLHTGGRRGDIYALGPQHIVGGYFSFVQEKNRRRRAVRIEIPVRAELQAVIAATPTGDLSFIVSAHGGPTPRRASATDSATGAMRPACRIARHMACGRRQRRFSPRAARRLPSCAPCSAGRSSKPPKSMFGRHSAS
nr:integrase [Ancylobacter pratisalsi]